MSAKEIENIAKQNYIDNKENIVDTFCLALKEIKNKTCDTEFAKIALFKIIKEQECFVKRITKHPHTYADVKEEKKILNSFIKEAKIVFGKEYDKRYKND